MGVIDQLPGQLSGLSAGQAMLGSSLSSLSTLSTVTLGISALAPTMLLGQFFWLRGQFNRIDRRFARLEKLIDDQTLSLLKAGLDALEGGVEQKNNGRVDNAFTACSQALHTFCSRLEDLLSKAAHRQNRKELLSLTQHLSIAICAVARCDIVMSHDKNAEKTIEKHRDLLTRCSHAVLSQTLLKMSRRFFRPDLANDESGVELIRSMVINAVDVNILPKNHPMAVASQTLSSFVDFLMKEPRNESLFYRDTIDSLRMELRDALGIIEDTSRVLSLKSRIELARSSELRTEELIEKIQQEKEKYAKPSQRGGAMESSFVAWSI